jgi:hypothetical protein
VPGLQHAVEAVLAQRLPDRADEADGEVGVAIGEELGGERRELPPDGRAAAALRRRCRRLVDEAVLRQRVEVLPHGRVREPERLGQLGRGGRFDPLQPVDDAALGVGERSHRRPG